MKNLIFGLIAVVMFVLDVNSQEVPSLEEAKLETNIGNIVYKNKDYILFDTYILVYVDSKFSHKIVQFENYNIEYSFSESSIYAKNVRTKESIELQVVKSKNNIINYNLLANNKVANNFIFYNKNGQILNINNLNYEVTSSKMPNPRAAVAVLVAAIDAIGDLFGSSDCQTAITACAGAGGLPSTTITSHWWGGQSCSVTCNKK